MTDSKPAPRFDCVIEGDVLRCTLSADRDLSQPVIQFSCLAPMAVVSGGLRLSGLGGYTEVALPDLRAGQVHDVVLRYAEGFQPANRAWMPMRPELVAGTTRILLPEIAAGHRVQPLPRAKGMPDTELPVVPQPQIWVPQGARCAVAGVRCDDPAVAQVADLAVRRGLRFAGDQSLAVPLTVVQVDLPPDAYRLTITPEALTLEAGSYGGRIHGAVTLLHLLQHPDLACGQITDHPRFGWRGQHLDCARHFFALSSILDLLDLMALLKLNRFHWHFADDEAFRLRLTGRPDLAACTAARGPGAVMPAVFGEVGGGSYGPADVAAVLERAHALNIEVLPEIETPAHMLAVTRVYPDTRDPADNGAEVSVQGYQSNAVNPAMPATWDVLSDIVTEVGAMFPFGHLHLGCDELPEGTWMGSPAARGLMAEHDLSDTDDIQAWMMSRLAAIVTANGQRPCAWEEAARGNCGEAHNGIGHGAILFSWSGQGPGLEAARAGYDVVMTPAQHVYLDMAHSDAQDDWGASWAAFVDLEDTVAWEPVPQDLRDTDVGARILGVQGAYWAEFTTQDAQMWPMLLPRIFGVATQAWEDQRPAPGELTRRACAVDWLGRCYGVPF